MDFRLVSEKDSRLFSRRIFFHKLLWTCGLQFWLPCRNVYEKKPNFFDQGPKVAEIPKIIFSLNGSLRHVEYSSDNPSEKIPDKNPEMLHSVSEKDWKDEIYSGKSFSSKCSFVRVKRNFDNPVQSLSRKNQKLSLKLIKCPKKFSKENLSPNCSNGQLECTSDKHGDVFLPESKNFLSESPKVINKTLQLSCTKYLTKRALLDTTNAVLTTQLINIRQNHGDFLLNVRKRWGENSKRILLKIFLSPGEMQFWQPSQKTFGQKWKRSAQCRNKKT